MVCRSEEVTTISMFNIRRLGAITFVAITFVCGKTMGDAIVVTQAMKASTIAEFYIEKESIRLNLEIGATDLLAFRNIMPDEVHTKLSQSALALVERQRLFFEQDLVIRADGNGPLIGNIEKLTARKRIVRDEITGEPLPLQPDDAELVVYAEISYQLPDHPTILTIEPWTTADDSHVAANVGFVVYHLNLPVNDYRYLSANETLELDWADPWYSRFQNRNLRRQFDAPLSVFLYVEPFEVRKEIVVRPQDLQQWVDLEMDGKEMITVDEQESLKQRVADFLAERNPVTIDGKQAAGTLDRIHFIRRSLRKTGVIDPPEDLDVMSATLGVIFVYPINQLPQEVTMNWELFGDKINSVPAVANDEAGGLPSVVTQADPILRWQNFLTNPTTPAMLAIAPPPQRPRLDMPLLSAICGALLFGLLLNICLGWPRRRRATARRMIAMTCLLLVGIALLPYTRISVASPLHRAPTLTDDDANAVLAALLHNIYRAFDRREESLIYDRLAESISGELLSDVYLQIRHGIELENQGGARVKVNEVQIQETENSPLDRGFRSQCRWTVSGSVGHWGHVHQRVNLYEARFTVQPIEGAWRITEMEVLDERRLNAQLRRAAGESFPWAMLPASELKLAASATADKFSSADRLKEGS